VEPSDFGGLEEGVKTLIRNRELRMGVAGRAKNTILSQFGVSSFVQRMTRVYEELLDEGKVGTP
jgi:hypothetical protein